MGQVITDLSGVALSGAGDTLARNLIARLNAAYPAFEGYWQITVNEQGGTIEVVNLLISAQFGFLMHINKIDAEGRKVVMYAGELLERYRVLRSGANNAVYDSIARGERDFRGELVADHG